MKRQRLKVIHRDDSYYGLRFIWLHELRVLRAQRRVSGTNTKAHIKKAQRELARIRKEL